MKINYYIILCFLGFYYKLLLGYYHIASFDKCAFWIVSNLTLKSVMLSKSSRVNLMGLHFTFLFGHYTVLFRQNYLPLITFEPLSFSRSAKTRQIIFGGGDIMSCLSLLGMSHFHPLSSLIYLITFPFFLYNIWICLFGSFEKYLTHQAYSDYFMI